MTESQVWAAIATAAGGLALAGRVALRYLDTKHRLRCREMAHRERLAAFEHGAAPAAEMDDESAAVDRRGSLSHVAFGAGLVLLASGIGILVALSLVPTTPELIGLHDLRALGVIPLFTGIGLLLFTWLARREGTR